MMFRSSPGRTGGRIASLVLLLIMTLISLVCLEIAFRVYLFGFDGFLSRKPDSLVDIGVSGLIRESRAPGVLYELEPGLDTYYYLADLRTNADGLRDREHIVPKPPSTVRVAVLGDSYTLPLGVEIDDAFHTVLETTLEAEHPGIRYEFVNFGVPGYSLRQSVSVLEHKALAYQPDAVLVGFCYLNDYHVPPEDTAAEPFQVKPRQDRRFRLFAYEQAEILGRRYYEKIAARVTSTFEERDGTAVSTPASCPAEDVAYMREMFSHLADLTGPRNIPVVVAGLELLEPRGPCPARVAELATEAGLHFVDASGITSFEESPAFRIYPLDGHPNARANARFADIIMEYVREHQLFLPRVRRPEVSH